MIWNPERHLEIKMPWSDWLAREFVGLGMFTYRHLKYGTLVISQWLNKGKRMFREVLVVGTEPAEFDHNKAQALKQIMACSGEAARAELKAQIVSDERAMDRQTTDDAEEMQDAHRFFQRHAKKLSIKEDPFLRVRAGMSEA